MLSNAYFLAKFRFDTAKNEPSKNLQNFAKFANFADPNLQRPIDARTAWGWNVTGRTAETLACTRQLTVTSCSLRWGSLREMLGSQAK